MQLAIAQNPHIEDDSERQNLWDLLDMEISDGEIVEAEFDESAFERLKSTIQKGSQISVK